MYTGLGAWDWNVAMHLMLGSRDRLWSRFPIELDPDLIVQPHLYGWRDGPPPLQRARGRRRGDDAYTIPEVPAFMLYFARSPTHLDFLVDELCPLVPPDCLFLVVDAAKGAYLLPQLGSVVEEPLHLLPAFLNRRLGTNAIEASTLTELGEPPPFLSPIPSAPAPEDVARVERHPIHLWEAFLFRGDTHRWELIAGEVPLVGAFHTELAANRALMSCVADAERWTGAPAKERARWIEIERFRLRQDGRRLEARVSLTPADVRVAFMPVNEPAASEGLPTLAGVLCAGGDNGKTEWMNGYNWSTVICEVPGETDRLARALDDELGQLGVAAVSHQTRCDEFPRFDDGRWVIEPHGELLTLYMPLYRDGLAPVEALHPRVVPHVGHGLTPALERAIDLLRQSREDLEQLVNEELDR